MHWEDSFLLGVLEGLTEFLPVSSTGHLILLSELLGYNDEAAKSFEIVIQLGAIIAVVLYFRQRLAQTLLGMFRRDAASLRLLLALVVAFVPAAAVGLVLHKAIEERLQMKGPVSLALIAGGFVMIGIELYRRKKGIKGEDGLEKVTLKRALAIGFAQCFSLIPGMSRSMTTIVGGQLSGLSTATAAEFSFLLSIPTLGAATLFSAFKHRHALLAQPEGAKTLAIGLFVSFIVAMAVISMFMRFLKRFGLEWFGYYRVLFGAAILVAVLHNPEAWPKRHRAESVTETKKPSPPDGS